MFLYDVRKRLTKVRRENKRFTFCRKKAFTTNESRLANGKIADLS